MLQQHPDMCAHHRLLGRRRHRRGGGDPRRRHAGQDLPGDHRRRRGDHRLRLLSDGTFDAVVSTELRQRERGDGRDDQVPAAERPSRQAPASTYIYTLLSTITKDNMTPRQLLGPQGAAGGWQATDRRHADSAGGRTLRPLLPLDPCDRWTSDDLSRAPPGLALQFHSRSRHRRDPHQALDRQRHSLRRAGRHRGGLRHGDPGFLQPVFAAGIDAPARRVHPRRHRPHRGHAGRRHRPVGRLDLRAVGLRRGLGLLHLRAADLAGLRRRRRHRRSSSAPSTAT